MTDLRAPENLVDLTRYPLHEPDSDALSEIVATARLKLVETGSVSFPGFLTADATTLLALEAEALSPLAYEGPTEATPYFFNYDLAQVDDPSHPVNRRNKRALAQVAYDLIPPESALYRLYHWDLLPAFLAQVLGHDRLYRTEDPYQALNISVMREGGCQQWHYDRSFFVTTLLVQAAENGGDFEYVPGLREDDDEHFDEVRAVLDGDRSRVQRLVLEPGALNLFKGHYAMHRVTPVEGTRKRLQTILGYSPEPGVVGSLKSSILHYGPRVGVRADMSVEKIRALLE